MSKQFVTYLLLLYLKVFSTLQISQEELSVNFANALFKDIASRNNERNFVISPFLIERDLSLMLVASKNLTLRQLKRVLQFEDVEEENMLKFFEVNTKELKTKGKLYYHSKLQLRQTFLDIAQKYYQYLPEAYSVKKPKAFKHLERVPKSTIPNFFKQADFPVDQYSIMLTNSIIFSAQWKLPFIQENFRLQRFFNWGKSANLVMEMFATQLVGFADLPEMKAKAIELPFKNSKAQIIFLLPQSDETENDWYINIDFSNIIDRMNIKNVAISIPMFQVDYGFNFEATMKNLGLDKLFSIDADLSNAFEKPTSKKFPYLYHRTFLNIDKFGCDVRITEQRLILEETTQSKSSKKSPEIFFIVNRPFVFAIYDRGLIRLAGRIAALNV